MITVTVGRLRPAGTTLGAAKKSRSQPGRFPNCGDLGVEVAFDVPGSPIPVFQDFPQLARSPYGITIQVEMKKRDLGYREFTDLPNRRQGIA